jgi:hypothetical protein
VPGYDCRFGTIVDSTLFHSMPVGSHESMVTSQRYVDGLSPKTAPRQRKTRCTDSSNNGGRRSGKPEVTKRQSICAAKDSTIE